MKGKDGVFCHALQSCMQVQTTLLSPEPLKHFLVAERFHTLPCYCLHTTHTCARVHTDTHSWQPVVAECHWHHPQRQDHEQHVLSTIFPLSHLARAHARMCACVQVQSACVLGEVRSRTNTTQCNVCSEGSYSLDPNSTRCAVCPAGANCSGEPGNPHHFSRCSPSCTCLLDASIPLPTQPTSFDDCGCGAHLIAPHPPVDLIARPVHLSVACRP
jgi:hypothetical protein